MGVNNTILIHGDARRQEREASEVIIPGSLVDLTSGDLVELNDTVAGNPARMVAVEDDLQGKGIEDTYALGERVQFDSCAPGDERRLIIEDGSAAVVIGDRVEPVVAGEVQLLAAGVAVGIVKEAINASGGGVAVADRRFNVEFI